MWHLRKAAKRSADIFMVYDLSLPKAFISRRKSAIRPFSKLFPQTVAGAGRSVMERQVMSEPDTSSRHPIHSLGLGDTLR